MVPKYLKDPVTVATIVIAAATVINVAASIYMGKKTYEYTEITKSIYKASNRPYLGLDNIKVKDDGNKHLIFDIIYKNYGTIPATNVIVSDSLIVNGVTIGDGGKNIYNSHSNLFPQALMVFPIKIGTDFDNIVGGHDVLDLAVTIKYRGVSQNGHDEYEDYEVWRYDSVSRFFTPVEANAK